MDILSRLESLVHGEKGPHIREDSHKLKHAERFDPDINEGLTETQVAERTSDKLTNDKPINRTKSYTRIVLENVFNFCNTVTIILVALLFIAGGIGLAPLRSVINYVRDNREDYGKIDIVYGSRSKDDLVDYQEIINEWTADKDVSVYLTIDREQEGWDGHVGFVPSYVKELDFDTDKTVLLCGPPVMIKFTLQGLIEMGFDKAQVYTTMELKMKCGVGKCGRCNIGSKYVCKDGPVFRCDDLEELPDEY